MGLTVDPRWASLARLAGGDGCVVTGIRVVTAVAAVQIYCNQGSDLSAWMVWTLHDPAPGQEYLDDVGPIEWESASLGETSWIGQLGTEPLSLLGMNDGGRRRPWRLMLGDRLVAESDISPPTAWSYEMELIPALVQSRGRNTASTAGDCRTRALAGLAASVGMVSGLRLMTPTAEVEVMCDASFQDTLTLSWILLAVPPGGEYLAAKTLEWELDESSTQDWIEELGVKPLTLLGVEGGWGCKPFALKMGASEFDRSWCPPPKQGWSFEVELIPGNESQTGAW